MRVTVDRSYGVRPYVLHYLPAGLAIDATDHRYTGEYSGTGRALEPTSQHPTIRQFGPVFASRDMSG